jgi:flagellar biosynthesis/type III secretory pathway protein FliH
MAGEALLTVSEDERLQAWLMSAEKYELDRRSDLYDARRDGYEEAEAKYQEQIRQVQEQSQEQIRQVQEQSQEQIRRLEEEIRRLSGE